MRPPSPSIPEREFLFTALKQSLRLDGRSPLEMRTPSLIFGPEFGWVECSLGKTRVIASVDGKMVKPPPERPFEGIITIQSEISPMASSEYEVGRTSDEEVTLTRILDKILRRSDVVDKESLCILAGQRVWQLRLTIHCLADAGNLLDCACLAGIVALKHFRRPEVEVIGDEVTVHAATERAPLPLSLHHTPFCLTFALFPESTSSTSSTSTPVIITILDPSLLEYRLATGFLHVAMNAQRELCVVQKVRSISQSILPVHKITFGDLAFIHFTLLLYYFLREMKPDYPHFQAGGVPLALDQLLPLIKDVAVTKVRELDAFVESRMKDDWEGRRKLVEVS